MNRTAVKAAAQVIVELDAQGHDEGEIDWAIRERFPALTEVEIHQAFDIALRCYRGMTDDPMREAAALANVLEALERTGCRTLAEAANDAEE